MPSSNTCWGIEVGAGGVKALKLEATGEGVRVADFAVIAHPKVLSTPGLDPSDALRVTLGAFVSQFDLTGAAVAVSVPGHSAFARFAKLPPVEPKKIPDIVKFEAVQQIPFPIEQVEWDYQTFKDPDSPDIEVGIFAITRERIMERLTLLEDVGITPDFVTLSPVAAYNALAYDLAFTEKTPGTIILDIGTTSTDLVIAEAGRVWIRTFPIGGHHFTEALVNAFQLSYPKAEKLKREAESSKHARHIFQAMRPVFGDLAQDVQRSIGYYQSLHKEAKLERLVGLGSTFRLPGLRKYLKQQVGMDVFRMEQFKRLTLDGPRAGEFQALTLQLGTAYGLALQGLGMVALDANLMPVRVIRSAMWRRKVRWFGIAAGIAIAGAGAMFIRPFIDNAEINANPEPPVIKQAVMLGNTLKSDAADVTNPTFENAAAGEVLGLLEGREIYGYIVDDLGKMLKFAQDRASKKEQPAFVVSRFDTAYLPAPGPEAAAGMPAPDASGGTADASLASQPRIQITLVASTTEPDAQRFAINTLQEWLQHNAKRAGVPYEIVARGSPRQTGISEAAAPSAPAQPVGAPQPMGTNPMGGKGAPVPMGLPEGGRSGRVMPGGPPPTLIPSGITPGPEVGGPPPVDQTRAQQNEEVRKLAPLPGEPAPEAGTRTTTFTVNWEAVLLPKSAPAPSGGGQ
jgi:type IV pilus assembly protein PilM